jgi:ABC-type bacteriocin/lantibiotic exporter with double-glycine peptidase domain
MAMVTSFWIGPTTIEDVRAVATTSPRGIEAAHLRTAANQLGLRAFLVEGTLRDLEHELAKGRPVIVGLVKPHGRQARSHYEVVVAANPARRRIVTLDPGAGWRENSYEGFAREWIAAHRTTLVVVSRLDSGRVRTAARDTQGDTP